MKMINVGAPLMSVQYRARASPARMMKNLFFVKIIVILRIILRISKRFKKVTNKIK